jgi:hypothetical protein
MAWTAAGACALALFLASVWFTFIHPDGRGTGGSLAYAGPPLPSATQVQHVSGASQDPSLEPVTRQVPPDPTIEAVQFQGNSSSAQGRGADDSLPGELFRRPSSASTDVSAIEEIRWCLRKLVRLDILTRFSLDQESLDRMESEVMDFGNACAAKNLLVSTGMREELLGPGRNLGIEVVREALAEARVRNPDLVMRPLPMMEKPRGVNNTVTVREAQFILDFLGLAPGSINGEMNPMTSEALRRFQMAVGLPDTGSIDERTGALLRNSVFQQSLFPFSG